MPPLSDPRWFPFEYFPHTRQLQFRFAERSLWASKPFVDERWVKEPLDRCAIGAAALMHEQLPMPPINFIWHLPFCGSTLLANLLEKPGRNLSLREPQVLVTLAHCWLNGLGPNEVPYQQIFALLGRRFEGDDHVTIKPSNGANALIAEAARSTTGRMLFLYCDLESFLIAVLRRGWQDHDYVHRLFNMLAREGLMPRSAPQMPELSFGRVTALVWYMQLRAFRRTLVALGSRAAALDIATFFSAPEDGLAALDKFFDLELGAEHVAQTVAGGLMRSHAKEGRPYSPEQRLQDQERARAMLGRALPEVIAWLHACCPDAAQFEELPKPLHALAA